MKRKLLYAAGILVIAMSMSTCTKNCKTCQRNTYDANNTLVSSESATEYCDAALLRIEATPDATVLGSTTKWECK
jgi:heterodisulfide reductase subunit B